MTRNLPPETPANGPLRCEDEATGCDCAGSEWDATTESVTSTPFTYCPIHGEWHFGPACDPRKDEIAAEIKALGRRLDELLERLNA